MQVRYQSALHPDAEILYVQWMNFNQYTWVFPLKDTHLQELKSTIEALNNRTRDMMVRL